MPCGAEPLWGSFLSVYIKHVSPSAWNVNISKSTAMREVTSKDWNRLQYLRGLYTTKRNKHLLVLCAMWSVVVAGASIGGILRSIPVTWTNAQRGPMRSVFANITVVTERVVSSGGCEGLPFPCPHPASEPTCGRSKVASSVGDITLCSPGKASWEI